MRALNGLALIICVACQEPDPIVGTYDLRTVLDVSQSLTLPLPATVQVGLSIPPNEPVSSVIHSGTLRMNSNGTLFGSISIGGVGEPPEPVGFYAKWSRKSDGIHFSDGEGYEYTSTMRGDTLGMSCFQGNIVCNYTRR